MSLAKATFSGCVYREPQMRSTSNNVPITYFTFNISNQGEEDLIRVRAVGNLAEVAEKEIKKNDMLVVEGNLTMPTIKDETGAEKKIVELAMISYEKIAGSSQGAKVSDSQVQESLESESLVKFSNDVPDDLISEDEIPF